MVSQASSDPATAAAPFAALLELLRQSQTVRYTNVAFLMLMVYDHAITFDLEVSRIWSLPWRLPKYLFLMNRYVVPPMLFFGSLVPSIYDLPQEVCDFVARWTSWPTLIALGTIELMLILRVLALYSHSKKLTCFLAALFALEMAAFIALSGVIISETTGTPGGDVFSGCLYAAPAYFYVGWIPPVIFESIIVVLTIYKVIQFQRIPSGSTLQVLARDSMVYFVVMFSVLLSNLLIARFGKGFLGALLIGPSNVIACLAAARMTMNIREVTMSTDDGSTATGRELGTIKFCPRRGAETLDSHTATGEWASGTNTKVGLSHSDAGSTVMPPSPGAEVQDV